MPPPEVRWLSSAIRPDKERPTPAAQITAWMAALKLSLPLKLKRSAIESPVATLALVSCAEQAHSVVA